MLAAASASASAALRSSMTANSGGHPGLERKAAQQRLAEGVDRRDLDAARRVEHPREELPGVAMYRPRAGCGRSALTSSCASAPVGIVVQLARRCVEPVGHLGRGGAGEGQAENARRVGAVEHQRQQPVGQHLGLAGARRGRDPDRGGRVERLALRRGRRRCCRASPGLAFVEPFEMGVVGIARRPARDGHRRDRGSPDRRSGRSGRLFQRARDRSAPRIVLAERACARRPDRRRRAANIRAPPRPPAGAAKAAGARRSRLRAAAAAR